MDLLTLATQLSETRGRLQTAQSVADRALSLAEQQKQVLEDCAARGEQLSRRCTELSHQVARANATISRMRRSAELAGYMFDEFGELRPAVQS